MESRENWNASSAALDVSKPGFQVNIVLLMRANAGKQDYNKYIKRVLQRNSIFFFRLRCPASYKSSFKRRGKTLYGNGSGNLRHMATM